MKLQKGISSIIVEFHNIMTHHSIQLQNKEEFSLADLSDTCLILAYDLLTPFDLRSQIYRAFDHVKNPRYEFVDDPIYDLI